MLSHYYRNKTQSSQSSSPSLDSLVLLSLWITLARSANALANAPAKPSASKLLFTFFLSIGWT